MAEPRMGSPALEARPADTAGLTKHGAPATAMAMANSERSTDLVHVLFIIDQLCEAGGAERMLLHTIRLLPKDRFRCSLIAFKLDPDVALFRTLPCPHQILPLRRTYDWNAIVTARKIREFIRRNNVQIVHTMHETSDLWAGLVAKLSGVPILVSSRRDMGILRSAKHRYAYRWMNRFFDHVLTVSEEVRRLCLAEDRIAEGRVTTLYNGLELPNVPPGTGQLRTLLALHPSSRIVVTVGHVRPIKGLDVLVESAALVVRDFPDAVFLVVGRTPNSDYYQAIKARIAQLGIQGNILFFGETEHIPAILSECDIFFLPSRSEGFSNALIEAMACGLPGVATRVGGNAEAIEEGASGYLFESEDSALAAQRILELLRNRDKATRMGARGREIVEQRFTAEVMIRQLTGCYERLLARSRRGQ